MPTYEYFCPANGESVEVKHSMKESIETWGELCRLADVPLGETSESEKVERVISAPNIHLPVGNSKLKEQGFSKLVKRDDGVYENVTATDKEKRYVNRDDLSSMPDLKKKNLD